MNSIFRTVRELLESSSAVTLGNAVHTEGYLYDDSVENLHALDMLEPSLLGLIEQCVAAGLDCPELREVIELLGVEA
jgi:hypothetical protein